MDHRDQQKALYDDLTSLVDRYSKEFDLTICQAIGCLELLKMDLVERARNKDEEDE